VFRLRAVLVGTVAYQTYAAMLGVRLPGSLMQTGDIDLARFADVSSEMRDVTPPISDVLRQVDASFRPVPRINSTRSVSYIAAASGLRVDFLTPNRGRDTDEPRRLPSFATDAQPLRFLDFLIRDPEPAVLLHNTGILVSVPAPQRYAVHKLIVARRRHEESGKREKDILQAGALLGALVERRPHELRAAWMEAFGRGKSWQRLMGEGLGLLHPAVRDSVLMTVGAPHSVVPGVDLRFVPDRATFDDQADGVRFFASRFDQAGRGGQEGVSCIVTRDALTSIAGGEHLETDRCLEAFRHYRSRIEPMIRAKYLKQAVNIAHETWLTLADLESVGPSVIPMIMPRRTSG